MTELHSYPKTNTGMIDDVIINRISDERGVHDLDERAAIIDTLKAFAQNEAVTKMAIDQLDREHREHRQ